MRSKDELKAIVESTIQGQGNQVDVGSKLALVLNELIDGMGGGGGGEGSGVVVGPINISYGEFFERGEYTAEEAAEIGITAEMVEKLIQKPDNIILNFANTDPDSDLGEMKIVSNCFIQTTNPEVGGDTYVWTAIPFLLEATRLIVFAVTPVDGSYYISVFQLPA